ncbi:hypothetical protein HY772_06515 [Candidatus Woesearchaeota archaeon]|nr:hypothetical protein [Candidatus Woesearchaeota archaeon]
MRKKKEAAVVRTFLLVLTLTILLTIIIVPFFFSVEAVETIDDVQPTIKVKFAEVVVLNEFSLMNLDTGKGIPLNMNTFDNETYFFQPKKSLQNGLYRLSVVVADLLSNAATYTYDFLISLPETGIYLTKPRIGVANATAFEILVVTTRESNCKYKASVINSFDSLDAALFDTTGANEHTIKNYTVQVGLPKQLFVVCRDNLGRDNFKDFMLYADTTPPVIQGISFDPPKVIEYPVTGQIEARMHAKGSEEIVCKYANDSTTPYEVMIPFEHFDLQNFTAYAADAYVDLLFPDDVVKKTFPLEVQCEDRAGWKSQRLLTSIEVDLTAALQIKVNSPPPATKNTTIVLNISTNKLGYCKFKTPTKTYEQGPMSSSPLAVARFHTAPFGTVQSGSYAVTFYCFSDQSGKPEEVELSYSFIVDNLPPSAPVINASPTICANTLKANFIATDGQSGVAYYIWEAGPQGASLLVSASPGLSGAQAPAPASSALASGTTTGTSLSVNKNNAGVLFNLSPTVGYVFAIKAVDKAGNIGPAAQSGVMKIDAIGLACDKTPPVVNLERSTSAFGDAVTIACTDTESGCDPVKLQYNAVYLPPCNASLIYLTPIPLSATTIVCYKAVDLAGNAAHGSQTFKMNTTGVAATCEGGKDSDGDGRGLGCPQGSDCDDTDPAIFVGCPNGCIEDADGDGYGPGCIKGLDCNGLDKSLTTNCPNGCISDEDGDGYGLHCNNGPDCNGLDTKLTTFCPNGCVVDNDGDGFGVNCLLGLDCNDVDDKQTSSCPTGCAMDLDGDGFGLACTAGADCDGQDPKLTKTCTNGCLSDNDGDGKGRKCQKGSDCDDTNPLLGVAACPSGCLSDNDGDGYGWGCSTIDCNDASRQFTLDCTLTSNCKYDGDGDGYGLGCQNGPDCDDEDKDILNLRDNVVCKSNCTYDADCNGIPDEWQLLYFNSTICEPADINICGANADPDKDGLTNLEEYRRGTDPWAKDEAEALPEVQKPINPDEDGDGMLDVWELKYGLDPKDPFDAQKDKDGDGLANKFEHDFKEGSCMDGTDPTNKDTDGDGYDDKKETDKKTDPCDPESHPSGALIAVIFIALGLLSELGSLGYLIYKQYYVPLITPQTPKPAAQAAGPLGGSSVLGVGAPPKAPMRHLLIRPPSIGPEMSREKFLEEARKHAAEREKVFGVFGERRKSAAKAMEEIARRPEEKEYVSVKKFPAPKEEAIHPAVVREFGKKKITEDHVVRLSKLIEDEAFDKLTMLTKAQVNDFEKLARIAARKEGAKLEEDQVAKLASITKKVEDKKQLEQVAAAMQRGTASDFEALDKLAAESVSEENGEAKEVFESLEAVGKGKRDDVLKELASLSESNAKIAKSKIELLVAAESKEELLREFEKMSRHKALDKNVFEVIFSFLLKTGKITKRDVSELLFDLEEKGILSKQNVAEVFFNLGVQQNS